MASGDIIRLGGGDLVDIHNKKYRPRMGALIEANATQNFNTQTPIQCTVRDDTHTYVANGDSGTLVVKKYTNHDLSKLVGQFIYNSNGSVLSMAIDGDFIYVGGNSTNCVKKYNKHTLQLVGQTPLLSAENIQEVFIQGEFIYISTSASRPVRRYNKNTLVLDLQSPVNYSALVQYAYYNGQLIVVEYLGGVCKLDIDTLVKVQQSTWTSPSASVKNVIVKGNYLYMLTTHSSQTLVIMNLDTLEIVNTSSITSSATRMTIKGDILYLGQSGTSSNLIRQFLIDGDNINFLSNSTTLTNSPTYFDVIGGYLYYHQNASLEKRRLYNQIIDYKEV